MALCYISQHTGLLHLEIFSHLPNVYQPDSTFRQLLFIVLLVVYNYIHVNKSIRCLQGKKYTLVTRKGVPDPPLRVQWRCFLRCWICILTSFNASSHENQEREVSYLLTLSCTELSQVKIGLRSGRHFEYQFLKKLLPQQTLYQGLTVLNALWRCPVLVSVATFVPIVNPSRRIPGH